MYLKIFEIINSLFLNFLVIPNLKLHTRLSGEKVTYFRQVSVIIPTYNRADYLQICLNALANLKTDPTLFEIVIVDNNSTDNTHSLVLAFAQSHPNMRVHYFLETSEGLSYGRNRGVNEAEEEFVFVLD